VTELILKRVAAGLAIVFAATAFIFILANGIGDPAVATLGPNASPERRQEFRVEHGLTDPLPVQFGRYVGAAVQGDLGRSFRTTSPSRRSSPTASRGPCS